MIAFWSLTLGALAAITLVPRSTQFPAQNVDSTPSLNSANALTLPLQAAGLKPLNASTSLGVENFCVGRGLGYGLLPASCQNIIPNSLLDPHDDTLKTWGLEITRTVYDFPMPQRFVSRDGRCFIDTNLIISKTESYLSQYDFVRGVTSLINACVVNNPRPQAGIGKRLGGDNRLEITLLKREPTVRCYGSADVPGIFESCVNLMNNMDWEPDFQKFGTGPGVNVPLPYTKQSADGKCYFTVRSDGVDDEESWVTIRTNAVAFITYMCAAQGKKGILDRLGMGRHLSLEMGAVHPPNVATS